MSAQGVLAATLVKPGQYELREYPLPEPGPGCVLVKMEMSGICGTDKHTFQGYVTQYGDRKLEFPIIQGHENVGTIAAIGGDGRYAGGEEPAAYGPSMRQMARYMKQYPLREFVTHRYGLRDVDAAMAKAIEAESMKVVMEPWR